MNPLLKTLLRPYMAPAGDGGSDTGGTDTGVVDRGDDFAPTDDAPAPKDEPEDGEGDPEDDPKAKDSEDKDPEDKDPDEDEEEKEKSKGKKDSRIPLARHKEILAKERAQREQVERQLAQYQQGSQVADLNETITKAEELLLGLEKEYNRLLADGELDKASGKMAEIRTLERQVIESKSDMKIAAAEARATERARYNVALERIEQAFPQLNPDHDDFSAELMEDIVDLKGAYERKGLTPTAAMQKAVDKLLGSTTKKQEAALETTPRVSQKDVAAERKKEAVKKTLDTVSKQPPSTTKVGMDSDKAGGALDAKAVMKMSQEDFSKLPEEALARMRGDEI